ncbi:MAG: MaoC family dehydratase [Myxococcota bacterium]|nr:MaoC family dehydratase [Myxococcota bacterium]
MKASPKFLLQQGPVLKSLLKTITLSMPLGPINAALKNGASVRAIRKETLPPRQLDLVQAYIKTVGGDPSWYKGILPPHMFPQWGFPIMATTLHSLPYKLMRILNGGCRFEVLQPLPLNEPLLLKARLESVKDDGKKAILTQRLETGTPEHPKCLVSHVTAIVPLSNGEPGEKREKKERPRVPIDAREIAQMNLDTKCGIEFGYVTGDVNPVHWLAPYARMSGFKNTILHGFSGMARTVECLNRSLWSGSVSNLKTFEMRFVRPLVLPATIGVFIDEQGGVFLGKAPGAPASFTGSYTTK